jgi:hypothetical protein
MLQLAAIFSVHCAITLRGAMVTIRTKWTRSERVNAQCVTHGPDGARRLYRCAPPGCRGVLMPLAHVPVTRSRAGYAVGKPAEAGRCQTRPVRSGAMPLSALDDSGQPVRVLEGGPRRASCADCGAPMRARTGPVRIWHWAHLVHNPRCKAARATEWHLAWKVLAWPGGRAPRHRACPQPRPSTVP